MTRLLVSVRSVAEAEVALLGGADFIDAKNPDDGALGALDLSTISAIKDAIGDAAVVSAVTGNHDTAAEAVQAALDVASTGVPVVKVGLSPSVDAMALLTALDAQLADKVKLVAVLVADQAPDFTLIPLIAKAGFYGVMLDTSDKTKPLYASLSDEQLADFIRRARAYGLMAGLAGGLTVDDCARLKKLNPGLVGFRGGVSLDHQREKALDPAKVRQLARAFAVPLGLAG